MRLQKRAARRSLISITTRSDVCGLGCVFRAASQTCCSRWTYALTPGVSSSPGTRDATASVRYRRHTRVERAGLADAIASHGSCRTEDETVHLDGETVEHWIVGVDAGAARPPPESHATDDIYINACRRGSPEPHPDKQVLAGVRELDVLVRERCLPCAAFTGNYRRGAG